MRDTLLLQLDAKPEVVKLVDPRAA